MIELFEQDIRTNDRQSSKGNQLKWENHGIWYKADYTGYEGLAEYVVSHLLQKSTLNYEEYVLYDLEQIKYRKQIYNGVKSDNFLKEGWQIITLERLFKNFFGMSLYQSIYRIAELPDRLNFLVNQIERITGLKNYGEYICKMFTIDAMFLNEDRHTHNIAVLMNAEGKFMHCPFFDHGAGLLADTKMDYPLSGDVYQMMNDVTAKTICRDFDDQLDVAEAMWGKSISFDFNMKDVEELLDQAVEYSSEERERVKNIMRMQIRKYQYLMK